MEDNYFNWLGIAFTFIIFPDLAPSDFHLFDMKALEYHGYEGNDHSTVRDCLELRCIQGWYTQPSKNMDSGHSKSVKRRKETFPRYLFSMKTCSCSCVGSFLGFGRTFITFFRYLLIRGVKRVLDSKKIFDGQAAFSFF